jgi:hypothetical protein
MTEIHLLLQFKISAEMYGSIGSTFLSFYKTDIVCRYVYITKNEMDPRANKVNNGKKIKINVKHEPSSGPNKLFHSQLY